jgi:hypothetical protein
MDRIASTVVGYDLDVLVTAGFDGSAASDLLTFVDAAPSTASLVRPALETPPVRQIKAPDRESRAQVRTRPPHGAAIGEHTGTDRAAESRRRDNPELTELPASKCCGNGPEPRSIRPPPVAVVRAGVGGKLDPDADRWLVAMIRGSDAKTPTRC